MMESKQFDDLLRTVAGSPSRRGMVRGLSGLALAGPLGAVLGVFAVDAKKKGKGNGKGKGHGKGKGNKGCKGSEKKCGNKCIPEGDCCSEKDCDTCALEVCQKGVCGCDPNMIRHNGVCGTFDNCLAAGEITSDAGLCCSIKSFKDPESGQERCLPGDFRCITPIDCGGAPCRGFMCPGIYHTHAPNCS